MVERILLEGGKEIPYKFSRGAFMAFEKAAGIRLAEFDTKGTIEHQLNLCYQAYKVGMQVDGKENTCMKFDEFIKLDNEHGFIDGMWGKMEDEKKRE